jgi:hypothetical protein
MHMICICYEHVLYISIAQVQKSCFHDAKTLDEGGNLRLLLASLEKGLAIFINNPDFFLSSETI